MILINYIMITLFIIIFLSAWTGNIVTSFFYRLPRNIPIHRDHNPPMCSACGTKLKFYQYMPLFYRVFCSSKTHCCGTDVPNVYTAIEALVIFSSVITYLTYGLSNLGLTIMLSIPVITCILFIFYYNYKIPKDILWAQVLCLIIYRLYGLQTDLLDIMFVAMFTMVTLLIIEKICKTVLVFDVRIILTTLTVFMPDGFVCVLYMIFIFIMWFLIAKKIINNKQSHIAIFSVIALWYPMILLH